MKALLALVAAAVAAVLVIAAAKPDNFLVTRSMTIRGEPGEVFAQINDLEKWQTWSPWAKLDPEATVRFEGPKAGVGARFFWEGNSEVGKGSMEIIESRPDEFVRFNLEFEEPMEATNTAEFALAPQGADTLVTWKMYGLTNFIGKVISVFVDCDKMIGSQFEQGLVNLNAAVTKARG